jgi:hypothetical protein
VQRIFSVVPLGLRYSRIADLFKTAKIGFKIIIKSKLLNIQSSISVRTHHNGKHFLD